MLAAVAHALRDHLRAEDQLGRLGGEEFLALLPDTGSGDAGAACEKLRASVEARRSACHDQPRLGGVGGRNRPTRCSSGPTTRCTLPRRAGATA